MTSHVRHRHRTVRGARSAAVAELLLVLAVPPALLTGLVGNPLQLPVALRSVHVLTESLDDATVLWLLGSAAWLLWLHLLGCLLVEVLRQLRGSPVRMPLPGLLFGANSLLASHLIAALLLPPQPMGGPGVLTPANPRISTAASVASVPDRHLDLHAAWPTDGGRLATHHTVAAGPTSAGSAGVECRVLPPQGRHHDTLWDIASRHLGDGTRWREIYALNAGRRMPDGQHLTQASLIRPGWILRLPADATVLDLDRVPASSPLGPRTQAVPGAPRQAAGHQEREQPAVVPELPPWRRDRIPVEDAPDQRAIATVPDRADGTARGSSVPTPVSTPPINGTAGAGALADPAASSSVERLTVVASLGALGIGALGLLTALTRRRKIAARRRPIGVRHARPSPELLEVEAQLRIDARRAENGATTVRLTLQLATRLCAELPILAVWQHPDGSIELVLAGHEPQVPAPAPFEATERGWLLPVHAQRFLYSLRRRSQGPPSPADLAEHAADSTDPVPLLLPVGEQDGSACLVNLEPLGLISLLPPPGTETADAGAGQEPEGDAALVMAAWAQAVAGAPWAEQVQLYLPPGYERVATGLDRTRCLDPAAHDSDSADVPTPLDPADRATLGDRPTLAAARRVGVGSAELLRPQLSIGFRSSAVPDWLPAAALDPLDPNTLLVAGPHPDAHAWQLAVDGTLSIPGIAARLRPLRLDPIQHERMLQLLEHAEDPPHAQPPQPEAASPAPPGSSSAPETDPQPMAVAAAATTSHEPASPDTEHHTHGEPTQSEPVAAPRSAAADEPDPPLAQQGPLDPGPVEVAILGPVQIHGAAEPRPRQQSIEMLVYLALHRRPVTLTGLSAAIWPDRPYVERTVRNRLSELRPYIHRRLDKLAGGRYQLTDLVVTDWQRFQNLADGNPAQQLAALALVRGAPFHGLGLDWYHLDGQLAEIEAAIVDLAVEVGNRALKHGEPDLARTAAVAGLRGCPYDERLYRIAMQAAAARGATGELHELRRQLAYVLDEELEPDDTIQPGTERLYTELRARPASPRR
jgi:hypothetical protein